MALLILDAGHAKSTSGKRNTLAEPDFREYEFNNDMQYRIKKACEKHGITVKLTNPDPVNVKDISLTNRANKANEFWRNAGSPSNALFISLHANASGSCKEWANARGVEVYHASNASQTSKNLALKFANQIYNDIKKIDSGFKNRGRKQSNFTVIYKTNCKAVLIEYGFYDNKQDLNILNKRRMELVEATVKVICQHFGINYQGIVEEPLKTAPTASEGQDWKNGTYNCLAETICELNVRKGRPGSKDYDIIIKTLPKGTKVQCGYCLDGWVNTYQFSNVPGFLRTKFLRRL